MISLLNVREKFTITIFRRLLGSHLIFCLVRKGRHFKHYLFVLNSLKKFKIFFQNDLDGDFKLDDMDLDTSASLHESETEIKIEAESMIEAGTEPEVKIKDEENQPDQSTGNDEVQAMEIDSKEDVIKKEEPVDDTATKNSVSWFIYT